MIKNINIVDKGRNVNNTKVNSDLIVIWLIYFKRSLVLEMRKNILSVIHKHKDASGPNYFFRIICKK